MVHKKGQKIWEKIRENMSKQDIIINMLEIANHLSKQEGDVNQIDVKVKNLNMHFEAWMDDTENDM
jgi:hypothetical protein